MKFIKGLFKGMLWFFGIMIFIGMVMPGYEQYEEEKAAAAAAEPAPAVEVQQVAAVEPVAVDKSKLTLQQKGQMLTAANKKALAAHCDEQTAEYGRRWREQVAHSNRVDDAIRPQLNELVYNLQRAGWSSDQITSSNAYKQVLAQLLEPAEKAGEMMGEWKNAAKQCMIDNVDNYI